MTLLHHAEAPGKRFVDYEQPILVQGQRVWRRFHDIDSEDGAFDYSAVAPEGDVISRWLGIGAGAGGAVPSRKVATTPIAPPDDEPRPSTLEGRGLAVGARSQVAIVDGDGTVQGRPESAQRGRDGAAGDRRSTSMRSTCRVTGRWCRAFSHPP